MAPLAGAIEGCRTAREWPPDRSAAASPRARGAAAGTAPGSGLVATGASLRSRRHWRPRATSHVVRSRFKVRPWAEALCDLHYAIHFVSSAQWPHLGSKRRHEAGAGISSSLVRLREPEGAGDTER